MTRTRLRFVIAKRTMLIAAILGVWASTTSSATADETRQYDVVVYGGTSAGIAAAVQVRRMGGSVVVIEPSSRIGGLTTGGLGQTDIGNKAAIGGVAREFYQRVRKYYDDPKHWKWQPRETYRGGGQSPTGDNEEAMWTFEPSAALSIMQDLVREHQIPVVYRQRLDRTARGVKKAGPRIVAITMESGQTFRGRLFIDATYEGDVLATAGVSFAVGRESNETHQETLNGVQTRHAKYHQFLPGVDPYVNPGDPTSGLLPGIDPHGPGNEGEGDRRVQAFCFRMCLTDHPENRIPFAKPVDYDPLRYELLLRNFAAGEKGMPWINSGMPNRKTDTNNRTGFSTDFIGENYEYPAASYAEREEIVARHRSYQQGLMWTLANHQSVPDHIRREVARWGTCRDEFEREDGWQQQLYVREARRMIGTYVMTQHNCQGRVTAEQPIGMAAYTMDSHHVQRYVDDNGHVRNEGDVEIGGFPPYPIDYRSITPKKAECDNLLVPVCLSASHIAFGSIRMEPVFMVLGQSAATAAMQAIAADTAVQQVKYDDLKKRLLSDRQVLTWNGSTKRTAKSLDPKSLDGIVVDETSAQRQGFDETSQVIGPFVGAGYQHDGNTGKGKQSARFKLKVSKAGRYEVRVAWTPNENRATNVPVTVHHADGQSTVRINQRRKPGHGPFGTVGAFSFPAGQVTIEITNADTDGYVILDAVQLVESAVQDAKESREFRAAMAAHHICSGLWVVGRSYERTPEEVVAQDLAPFKVFGWELEFQYEVDHQRRTVTVTAPDAPPRTAKYNGDQGSTILPRGETDVYYEHVPVPRGLPDAATQPWPTGDAAATEPIPDGVDTKAVSAALDWAMEQEEQNTRAFVVAYRGKIIGERYAQGWTKDTPQISWSQGKSITAALVGVLVERGHLKIDQPAPVKAWQSEGDPRGEIRIRDLLRMSSGLDFINLGLDGPPAFTTKNEHMRVYFDSLNVLEHAVNQPPKVPPNTRWSYLNSDPLTLGKIIRDTVEAQGEEYLTFPQRALFDRIGARNFVLETDAWGNFILSGYDYGSARDWVRFGLLHLWDGVWQGERILPEGWTEFISTPAPAEPTKKYGGLFWLNRPSTMDQVPKDAYWSAGFMGQITLVIPSRDMVVVRMGPSPGGYYPYLNEAVGRILKALPEKPPANE